MDCTNARRNARPRGHAPMPSRAEELEAEYGDRWEIYRDLGTAGSHGPWRARRLEPIPGRENELADEDIESLATQLAAES